MSAVYTLIAYAWAQQTAPAKTRQRMSFEGPKLYSYETLVGVLHPDGAVLLTTKDYSRTTDAQIAAAVRALNETQRENLFRVPEVDLTVPAAHAVNLHTYDRRLEMARRLEQRGHERVRARHRAEREAVERECSRYIQFFRLTDTAVKEAA